MTDAIPTSPILLRNVRNGLPGDPVDILLADGVIREISPAATGSTDTAEVFDGAGATALPGLRDAHTHLTQWAVALQRVDVAGAASAEEAAATMARAHRERQLQPGQFLTGFGFRDGLWPAPADKAILESALPGVPVAVVSQDLHAAWFSPAALTLIGLDHPTGVLREAECFDAVGRLPDAPEEIVDGWAVDALRGAAARGVTSVTDFEFTDTITTWTRRHHSADGGLPVRVRAAIWRTLLNRAIEQGWRTGDIVAGTTGLLTIGPCKVLVDGSLNTRTALCHQAYPGVTDPAEAHGLLTQDPVELAATIARAAVHGIGFAVHAIGDRANTLALDCFEQAGVGGRIEHAQLVDAADLPRFAKLGVAAGVQPAHAVEDRDVADVQWRGRTDRSFAYRSLLDAGAVLEFGSDAPVSRLDPWHAIAAAVRRTDDERPAWHGEQALTLTEAIAASTGGATALRVGDPADLVLTDQHPAEVPLADLADMPVTATLLGGGFSYRSR